MAYDLTVFEADPDEAGIHFDDFCTALAVWTGLQDDAPTVATAMQIFNVTIDVIKKAVDANYWMFIGGSPDAPLSQTIEQDGN
jgi:hypothetical protein